MRKDVSADDRAKFAAAVESKTVEAVTVEADPVADPDVLEGSVRFQELRRKESESFEEMKKENLPTPTTGLLGEVKDGQLGKRLDVDRFVEVKADTFKEAKFQVDIDIENLAAEEY